MDKLGTIGMGARLAACLLTALAILTAFGGCKAKPADERPLIVTSIYPYQILIQELVGDSIRVRSLVPANASPHTWTAKPADLKAMEDARLLVMNGMGLETELTQAFEERSDKLVNISKLLKMDELSPEQHAEEQHLGKPRQNHSSTGLNPHIWLSPQLMMRATILLADELQTRFPTSASAIQTNASRLIADLAAMHQQISTQRAAFDDPMLITYHDSFHWFTDDYDINVAATVQSSPGKEPTAKELALLSAVIRTNKIKAIYVEPQMDRRSAKVLADELELSVLELDPIGHSLKATRITDLLWNNWERMKMGWARRDSTTAR